MSLPTGTTLKVLNYNMWHGLNGEGTVRFGELEPPERRKRRWRLQLEFLKEQNADILFLQEVCPLFPRARELAKLLKMNFFAHFDQAGIKVLGLGLPRNLETGLVILARKELKLHGAEALKLSGGPGFLSRLVSLQVNEFRFALVANITWRGRNIQVINTHLHHGPSSTRELSKRLDLFFETHKELNRNVVEEVLERSRLRRFLEVQRLARHFLSGHKILCGDLNVGEDDPLISLLRDTGLNDVFAGDNCLTWDRARNAENHSFTKNMKLLIPTQGSQELAEIFKEHDARPRRLDYIMTTPEFRVESKSLVMDEPREGLIGSDHFGLSTVLSF